MASLLGASQAEEPHENPDPKVICVLGAGSFGTAMAFVAARRGNKVRIYARNQEQVKLIPLFTSVFFFVFF
jgi:NADP-dependent 3-hydroxy acid dehydrogenase YdfG